MEVMRCMNPCYYEGEVRRACMHVKRRYINVLAIRHWTFGLGRFVLGRFGLFPAEDVSVTMPKKLFRACRPLGMAYG